jgi:hypothetical protein
MSGNSDYGHPVCHLADFSYRSLELLCRKEAALASTPDTQRELLRMSLEYQRLADLLDLSAAESDTRK